MHGARFYRVPSTECGSVAHLQLVVNKSSELMPQALASDMRTDRLMFAGEQSLLGSLKMRDP
jgi:hypothetical protein